LRRPAGRRHAPGSTRSSKHGRKCGI
jgi:hypothetical protein